jgi:hypothetical protein
VAKKRFTVGLESLFEEPEEKKTEGKELLLFHLEERKPVKVSKKSKKKVSKNFTDDIQSFLKEAFEDSFAEQSATQQEKPRKTSQPPKKRRRKPLSGLDSLIRKTVEPRSMDLQEKPTRRLTITFDNQKLKKLKDIARLEKTYLKDIIDEIVGDFIKEYEVQKNS